MEEGTHSCPQPKTEACFQCVKLFKHIKTPCSVNYKNRVGNLHLLNITGANRRSRKVEGFGYVDKVVVRLNDIDFPTPY